MGKPAVSVLMSVHNSSEYLREAIESILNQTFKDFEFIIIDDASKDDSAEIIQEYAKNDSRVTPHYFHENLGLTERLNFGLSISKGNYIARMDADDISLSNRLQIQVEYMEQHPDIGVLGSWYEKFPGGGILKNPQDHRDIKTLLFFGNPVGHPTAVIRKQVLDENKIKYDTSYLKSQDYELWSRMIFVTTFHNIQQVLVKYRVHHLQVSTANHGVQKEFRIKIQENLFGQLFSNIPNMVLATKQPTKNSALEWPSLNPERISSLGLNQVYFCQLMVIQIAQNLRQLGSLNFRWFAFFRSGYFWNAPLKAKLIFIKTFVFKLLCIN